MKRKILSAVLLTVSLFSFSWNVNANYNLVNDWRVLDNAFWNSSLRHKIDNIFIKINRKIANQSIQNKVNFYNRLLKKIRRINTNNNSRLEAIIIYLSDKAYEEIRILQNQNNESNILNNLFWDIDESTENNSNTNTNSNSNINSNTVQSYKIIWDTISSNLTTTQNTLYWVKLWKFEISSSNWKYVRINSMWIKVFNSKWWKIPSVKYLKLYTAWGLFLKNIELTSKNWYSYKIFNIPTTDLKPWKYIIKWDVSDIQYWEIILKTQFDYSYSSSKLIYKWVDFGKVYIKKSSNNTTQTYKIVWKKITETYDGKYENFHNWTLSLINMWEFRVTTWKGKNLKIKTFTIKVTQSPVIYDWTITNLVLKNDSSEVIWNFKHIWNWIYVIKNLELGNKVYHISWEFYLNTDSDTEIKTIINSIDSNSKAVFLEWKLGNIYFKNIK